MLNRITIQGRVVKKPEMRVTQSGKPVASFTLAVERDYVAQGQERETDFLDVVAWNQKAEVAGKYLDKGSMAVVDGRLQIRTWTDKEGNKRRNADLSGPDLLLRKQTVRWSGEDQRSRSFAGIWCSGRIHDAGRECGRSAVLMGGERN